MEFQEWWYEYGQYLNDEIRSEPSTQEFWAKKGWEAALRQINIVIDQLEAEERQTANKRTPVNNLCMRRVSARLQTNSLRREYSK